MGPLKDGDYGVNYSQTIVDPGKTVGFGGSGSATGGNEGGSGFGFSVNPLQFISDTINTILQLFTNKTNREFAAQQAQLQNQWNLEQWNRENAYNSPLAQMQRYIEAGLNPNLVVGQQNLSSSSPQMVSGKDAPAGVAPRVDLGTAALQAAQVKNLNAQSNLIQSQSRLTDGEFAALMGETPLSKAQLSHLNQVTQNLSQQYNLNSLDELVTSGAFKWVQQSQEAQVTVVGPDGDEHTEVYSFTPLVGMIRDRFKYYFQNDELAESLSNLYCSQMFLNIDHYADYIDSQKKVCDALAAKYGFESQDLQKFLKVADDYYNGLRNQEDASGVLSQMNKSFFKNLGVSPALYESVTGAASDVISFLSKFVPRISKSNSSKDVVIHHKYGVR